MSWAVWYVTVRARDAELSQPHPVSGTKGPRVVTQLAVEAADEEEAKLVATMEMGSRGLSVVGFGPVTRGRSIDLHSEIQPNKRARALQRAAMDTRFGETVEDPDAIVGAEGKQLDAALSRYETFHDKAPIRIAELTHDIPTSWVAVGDALAVMYRTDKWKRDGSDIDYKHLHDKSEDKPYDIRKGVRLFEPASATSSGRSQRLPVAVPKAVTLLGYCLGVFVRKDDDGQTYETNPRGCYLFSSPSGDLLLLYSPDEQSDGSDGFLAAMAGGKLRVLKDGIDG